ncbi:hypothetical protein BDZ45DRAFT_775362 [Acephala macrosclerotiorum]|nr:hypothetical protein BDZ45DRAFT_775362 [Acephala macrosclerotiorum]
MALPEPPEKIMDHPPNGKPFCFKHHLKTCYECDVDFIGVGGLMCDEIEHLDRVLMLAGSTARFTPRTSPGCSWQDSEAAAKSHPSYHSSSHEIAGTRRSPLVFTDGACFSNGMAGAQGGIGVFFSTSSKFNLSERLTSQAIPTSQKAELAATARVIEMIRTKVLLERRIMVTAAEGGHDPHAVKNVMRLRLVIVTDSSYLVEGMCRHFSNWQENNQRVLINKAGRQWKTPVDPCN